MEYDKLTPPSRVVDSPCSHHFIDIDFPSYETILEEITSIYKPKEDVTY
jgi:hypothetical protein